MKKYIKYIILIICLIIFSIIAVNVYLNRDMCIDSAVYNFISKYFINDNMTNVMKFITWFGGPIGIALIGIISVLKNRKIIISMPICLVLGTILSNIVKVIFARERPSINPLAVETSYSFPSGHSMMSMILYGYLIYLIYDCIKNKKIKWIYISILSILILAIGFSRIYLGVHYTSDVIGGFTFGIAYLIIFIEIIKNKKIK